MGYMSRRGRRPDEYASKASHGHVIRDKAVQAFLEQCVLPKRAEEVSLEAHEEVPYAPVTPNPIRNIIAIDGGFQEVVVQPDFPSSTLCFFQFGALIFSVADLEGLDKQPFIDPDDMAKLKHMKRLKLTLPIRNMTVNGEATLTHSVRRSLYNFFLQEDEGSTLIETLRWFIFQEYRSPLSTYTLAHCPHCETSNVPLDRSKMKPDHTWVCRFCGAEILMTDVFRLYEAIDDELGAGGILAYVTTSIEQLILVHVIRLILETKPALLQQILFIKDGPLAFFGQTANLHKSMRALVRYLFDEHDLFLAGLEKSGPFVEHADEIADKLEAGTALLLDNNYIYRYVLPGKADPDNPYGRTTYYGSKLIFKTPSGAIYVVTVPTPAILTAPKADDLHHLPAILTNVEKLRCDMYDNALIPVALANKLVSLANHPSHKILQRFAIGSIAS